VLSGELGVSQAFLARWYIGGGYMDVSEVGVYIHQILILYLEEILLAQYV
jgi:hypothetical protein